MPDSLPLERAIARPVVLSRLRPFVVPMRPRNARIQFDIMEKGALLEEHPSSVTPVDSDASLQPSYQLFAKRTMKTCLTVLALCAVATFVKALPQNEPRQAGLKVLQGNDDGWAEGNIRQLYDDLKAAGANVVLSAPLNNESGSGSQDEPPTVPTSPGEYDSVPAGAPAIGSDPNDPRINYVNSYPVTAIKWGISDLSPTYFGGMPDIVVSGPNVGSNIGVVDLLSGTIGVAAQAASQGIPAIAFSGADTTNKPYTALTPGDSSHVYSQLAITTINAVMASNAILPTYFLTVNMGKPTSACPTADKFQWHWTRVETLWIGAQCSSNPFDMPSSELEVQQDDCNVSISPVDHNKMPPTIAHQTAMYNALKTKLSLIC